MACTLRGEAPYTWFCILILMLCYAIGELGHFLLAVTSKPMAQSIHFGGQGCMLANENYDKYYANCQNSSGNIFEPNGCTNITVNGTYVCKWDYKGDGVEYQLLAGPYFVIIFTVMGVVLGALGDRYNRVRILTACVFLCSVMVFLMGFSTEYWQLALLRLGFGGAEAGFSPLSASIIADTFGKTSRGLGMSVFNWGIYFGFGSAFAVGNLVTEALGWRWAYFISGMPGFLMTFVVFFSIREPERKNISATNDIQKSEKVNLKDVETISEEETGLLSLLLKIVTAIKIYIRKPSLIVLLIAACVRHSASFCFAYNAQLYFKEYYPHTNLGLWMTLSSIIGGSIGIASGGLISDLVVSKYGIHTRMSVLAVSQALASPFAFGVLYLPPPFCFLSLICAYLFAEMWFGILFAVLVELLPTNVRSTCLATFFFVINNVAGLVLLGVPDLKNSLGSREALTLVYPGFYLISSFFFAVSQLLLRHEFRRDSFIKKSQNDGENELMDTSE